MFSLSTRLARECDIWKMEEKHLHERHQTAKQQIKDQYHLQRHQLVTRHDKVIGKLPQLCYFFFFVVEVIANGIVECLYFL